MDFYFWMISDYDGFLLLDVIICHHNSLVDAKSPSRRCKTETENVYVNGGKAWVVGSFHSSFTEWVLDEFSDEHDLQKFADK